VLQECRQVSFAIELRRIVQDDVAIRDCSKPSNRSDESPEPAKSRCLKENQENGAKDHDCVKEGTNPDGKVQMRERKECNGHHEH
jgi:hypothetical protein